jgi:hypothetical protein
MDYGDELASWEWKWKRASSRKEKSEVCAQGVRARVSVVRGWGGVYGRRISMSAEYKMVLDYSGRWWMDITCTCITKIYRSMGWMRWRRDRGSNDSKQDSVKRWKYDVQESHMCAVLARLLVPSCCFVYLDTSNFFYLFHRRELLLNKVCGSRVYCIFQKVKIPKTTRRCTFHGVNLL